MAAGIVRKAARKGAALARGLRYRGRIEGSGGLLLHRGACVHMGEGAALAIGGSLSFGSCNRGACRWPSMMTLAAGSKVVVDGDFDFYYGADVQVFGGGTLRLGSGFVNSGCKVRCHDSISIGRGCVISHDFTVMDSNAHELDGSRGNAPVSIGDHVWIGSRVTVLPGVTVGDGAVVAAGAVVSRDVPPGSLVAGVPARVVRCHVEWRE